MEFERRPARPRCRISPGTVTAAQLPGFILSSNITSNGVISNATLANGAIDGNGRLHRHHDDQRRHRRAADHHRHAEYRLHHAARQRCRQQRHPQRRQHLYRRHVDPRRQSRSSPATASLGAAVPTGATIDPNNVKASVQAANGIIFNSLDEGNGTLTLGTANRKRHDDLHDRPADRRRRRNRHHQPQRQHHHADRPARVARRSDGVGVGNATGLSDLTIDDNSNNKGVLILSTASPDFFGNLIIGNSQRPDRARHERCGARQHHGPGGIDRPGRIERRYAAGRRFVRGARTKHVPRQRQQLRRQRLHHQLGDSDRRSAHAGNPQQQYDDGRRGHFQQPHDRWHGDAATGGRRGRRDGDADQRHRPRSGRER